MEISQITLRFTKEELVEMLGDRLPPSLRGNRKVVVDDAEAYNDGIQVSFYLSDRE